MIGCKQILLLIFLIIVESSAAALLKKGVAKKEFIVGGVLLYIIVALLFYFSLTLGNGIAITNGLWNAGTLVCVTIIGVCMFQEKLYWNHYTGLALGVGSALFLMFNTDK